MEELRESEAQYFQSAIMNDDVMQRLRTKIQAVDAQMAERKARHAMEKETWTKKVHAFEARINEEGLSFQDQRQADIVRAEEATESKLQGTRHNKPYSHGGWNKYASSKRDRTLMLCES